MQVASSSGTSKIGPSIDAVGKALDAAAPQSIAQLATQIMEQFGHGDPGWSDFLHEDVVIELPFATSNGLPPRVEGKQAVAPFFAAVAKQLDLKFHDIRVWPLQNPGQVVVEYRGTGHPAGQTYSQTYICFQEYKDGKLLIYREYYDTLIVKNILEHVSL
jgi:ketosteroid isomerase-like protein